MNNKLFNVLSKRIPKPLEFKIRREGKGYLVKPFVGNSIISLNELAGYILMKVDGYTTIAQIQEEVSLMFQEVLEEEIYNDILVSLRELEINHLVSFTNI